MRYVILLVMLLTPVAYAQPSGVSRALSAAFQEMLADGRYPALYQRYLGLAPRYLPKRVDAPWPVREDGSPLDRVLLHGNLRLGWCEAPPYHFRDAQGRHLGLDVDLAAEAAERIARHYGVGNLTVTWVEKPAPAGASGRTVSGTGAHISVTWDPRTGTLTKNEAPMASEGDEQLVMYRVLVDGLKHNEFEAGWSGLLVMPQSSLAPPSVPPPGGNQGVVSACATSVLFPDVVYSGRDDLDLRSLVGASRDALARYLGQQHREFTFLSTDNPGPSGSSARSLVEAVQASGGRASLTHATVPQLIEGLQQARAHFLVGDSISLGHWAHQPGFRGLNLDIPASDSTLELAPFTLPGGMNSSQLSQVLSAAFREFAARPGAYAELYQKYLGVRREAPDDGVKGRFIPVAEVQPGSTLDRVLRSGTLRYGFWRHAPYYYTDNGRDVGFELELGNAMGEILRQHYPQIQKVEWVEHAFKSDGKGQENMLLFDSMEPELLQGRFDVALTGMIRKPDRPVGVAASTMEFFCTGVYTGKDGLDLSSVVNRDREHLVQFLIAHPGCVLMSTPGGPSEETAKQLVADSHGACTHRLGTVPELIQAAQDQSVHFLVGDAIALSDLALRNHRTNLNIVLRGDDWIAPITALDE